MINITFNENKKRAISGHDLTDGHAYVVSNGAHGIPNTQVFICNKFQDIALFSLCGKMVIARESALIGNFEFEEVDLEVKVT